MKRISMGAIGVCLIAFPVAAQTGSGGSMAAANAPTELDAAQFSPPSARANGRISDMSQTTGAVRLQSSSAPLRLHFPTQALNGVSENAPVIVHIAYSLGEAPTGQQEAAGSTTTTGSGGGQMANAPAQGSAAGAPAQAGAAGSLAQAGAAGVTGGSAPAPIANVADEYSVRGTFSKIDQNYGLVTFTPEPMMLTVYLPREALQNIKPGDPMSAEVAFLKSPAGTTARAGDAPSGQPSTVRQGAHWMKATVSEVDQARGIFVAQADKFTLQLPIPAAIKEQIAANKTVGINLSFEPDTCSGPRATM